MTPRPQDVQLHLDAGHLGFWLGAMNLQADRTFEAEEPWRAQTDATFFALALRNVVRAIKLCRPHASSVADRALAKFEATVPHWQEIRNVLEHFDEYERGKGKLQDAGMVGEIFEWYERDGETFVLNVSGKWALDVRAAQEAASEMAGKVLEAMLPG